MESESIQIEVENELGLSQVINAFLVLSKNCKVVFLYGDLGAGKTTFVKHLVKHIGTSDEISSPTYSIINEYETSEGPLYHIDLYRLDDTDEAIDIGIEDYLFSKNYCFIEWPQIIESLVEDVIKIEIEAEVDGKRTFNLSYISNN